MTSTSHAITGAAVAAAVNQPWLAVPLAFASHFALDGIPHFDFFVRGKKVLERNRDYKFLLTLVIDSAIAAALFILMVFIFSGIDLLIVWLCMLAAVSPDLVWGWRFIGELKHHRVKPMGTFSKFHKRIQWKDMPSGIFIELFWIGLMFILLADRAS